MPLDASEEDFSVNGSLTWYITSRSTPRPRLRRACIGVRDRPSWLFNPIELGKCRPRRSTKDRGRITISQRRDKIRPHMGRVFEKGRVDGRVVTARHRARIEPEGAGRDYKIRPLQRAVAKGGCLSRVSIGEIVSDPRIVGKEFRQMLAEFDVHA